MTYIVITIADERLSGLIIPKTVCYLQLPSKFPSIYLQVQMDYQDQKVTLELQGTQEKMELMVLMVCLVLLEPLVLQVNY